MISIDNAQNEMGLSGHIDDGREWVDWLLKKVEEQQPELQLPEHILCPTAPEYIWLQTDPEPEEEGRPVYPDNGVEITWCSDWINPTDTLYVRADLINRVRRTR
ncbi:hypothetical protein [Xenorhabdus thuongxuanensis]|uniref:Uncharacterized protein n=1 Tax=Xenorhabdus thuongxuanensis TaxID=1873484 RepID=A0A1Q5TMV3_9GAMM|nr:hypothetical protein [Xenorhabdus thuongxuanensis]OKP01544.1 hypothetical protein Xentx_03417 [Xenorhabdus thuongxuanensis]